MSFVTYAGHGGRLQAVMGAACCMTWLVLGLAWNTRRGSGTGSTPRQAAIVLCGHGAAVAIGSRTVGRSQPGLSPWLASAVVMSSLVLAMLSLPVSFPVRSSRG